MAKYKTKGAAEAAAKRSGNRARNLEVQLAEGKKKAREMVAKAKAKLTGNAGQRVAVGAGGGGVGGLLVQAIRWGGAKYSASPGIAGQAARALSSPSAAGALAAVIGGGLALAAEGKPKRKMLGDVGLGMVSAGTGFIVADQSQRFLPVGAPVEGLYTQAAPYAQPARYIAPPYAAPALEAYSVDGLYSGPASSNIKVRRHQLQ